MYRDEGKGRHPSELDVTPIFPAHLITSVLVPALGAEICGAQHNAESTKQ